MGFRGYNGQTKAETYPEFYEKLKNLKVSICPLNEKGYIPKKVQTFNNSVGYASKEEGGNLIVKEQWLENPKWEIAFLVDDPQSENLAERILESRFEFLPYLGKNDHTAVIENVEEVELEAETKRENLRVYGLFLANQGSLSENSARRPLGREVPVSYTHLDVYKRQSFDKNKHPKMIRKWCEQDKVLAIGEIGLDYYYDDGAPRDLQKKVFEEQIGLANELKKPIIVHDRDAHGDCLDMVKSCLDPNVGGV